jgi:hypothetical protein
MGQESPSTCSGPARSTPAIQAHIQDQDPDHVGGGLVERFHEMRDRGSLVTPVASALDLVDRLPGPGTGQAWSFGDR